MVSMTILGSKVAVFTQRQAIPYTPALQCETPESVYRCLSRLQGERYTGLLYVKSLVPRIPSCSAQKSWDWLGFYDFSGWRPLARQLGFKKR